MQKKWLIASTIETERIKQFTNQYKTSDVFAELLLQRNLNCEESLSKFLQPSLDKLYDPFLMKNMDNAVQRLQKAIEENEKILLFGDYDVDGTTAVALVYNTLIEKHQNLVFYIPDRYKEGYGVSKLGIDWAIENNISLIISLDCGIRSVELIQYAKNNHVDFIVCDHHEPGEIVPNGIVLDPKQKDCPYPFKELSGCGVGFKLLYALFSKNQWDKSTLFNQLDLLAISIGADIVSVTDENRILASKGLEKLNENPRQAFTSLVTMAKKNFPLTLTDVVFTIAPRINAVGRLRSGKYAVQLMISNDIDEINLLAEEIEADNLLRREMDQEMTQEALKLIDEDENYNKKKSTVVFQEHWNKGVVGIVASRLIETHFKPTIVLTEFNGKITGSARTVNDFDIYHILCQCEHLLEQFGGHTHAAGLTMPKENLSAFEKLFDQLVAENNSASDLIAQQEVDLELHFKQIFKTHEDRTKIPTFKRDLDRFEPFGPGNMKPVFITKNVFAKNSQVLKEKHLKLQVMQPHHDIVLNAIGFNLADKIDEVASGMPFDIAYTLEKNEFRNNVTLQLNLKDIRPSIL